jgi:hypothetical protein
MVVCRPKQYRMRSTCVIILLSAVAQANAKNPIDHLGEMLANKVLSSITWARGKKSFHRSGEMMPDETGSKLADRAFGVWSPNHGVLDDTMYAKPGAKPANKAESFPTSPTKGLKPNSRTFSSFPFSFGFFRVPNLLAAFRRHASQLSLPVFATQVSPSKAGKPKTWAEESHGFVGNLGPLLEEASKSSITPEESAKISIAGPTPRSVDGSTPRSVDGSTPREKHARDFQIVVEPAMKKFRIIQDGARVGSQEEVESVKSKGSFRDEPVISSILSPKHVGGSQGKEPSNAERLPAGEAADTGIYKAQPEPIGNLQVQEPVRTEGELVDEAHEGHINTGDIMRGHHAAHLQKEEAVPTDGTSPNEADVGDTMDHMDETMGSSSEHIGDLQAQGKLEEEAPEASTSTSVIKHDDHIQIPELVRADTALPYAGANISSKERVGDLQDPRKPEGALEEDAAQSHVHIADADDAVGVAWSLQGEAAESHNSTSKQTQIAYLQPETAAKERQHVEEESQDKTSDQELSHLVLSRKFSADAPEFVPKFPPLHSFPFNPQASEFVPEAMKSWPKSFAEAAQLPHIGVGIRGVRQPKSSADVHRAMPSSSDGSKSFADAAKLPAVSPGLMADSRRKSLVDPQEDMPSKGRQREPAPARGHAVNRESTTQEEMPSKGHQRASTPARGHVVNRKSATLESLVINPGSLMKSWADVVKKGTPSQQPVEMNGVASGVDATQAKSSDNAPRVVPAIRPKSFGKAPKVVPSQFPVDSNPPSSAVSEPKPTPFSDPARVLPSHHGSGGDLQLKSAAKVVPSKSVAPQLETSAISPVQTKSSDGSEALHQKKVVFDFGDDTPVVGVKRFGKPLVVAPREALVQTSSGINFFSVAVVILSGMSVGIGVTCVLTRLQIAIQPRLL